VRKGDGLDICGRWGGSFLEVNEEEDGGLWKGGGCIFPKGSMKYRWCLVGGRRLSLSTINIPSDCSSGLHTSTPRWGLKELEPCIMDFGSCLGEGIERELSPHDGLAGVLSIRCMGGCYVFAGDFSKVCILRTHVLGGGRGLSSPS
jgi:hypothetical protein